MNKKLFLKVMVAVVCFFAVPLIAGCFGPGEARTCKAIWRNDDGTVIYQQEYKEGETPSFNGTLPKSAEQQDDVEWTWEFYCWMSEGREIMDNSDYIPIFFDTEYVANYQPDVTRFSFCFKNYDGEVLYETDDVTYDTEVTVNARPTRASTEDGIYKFSGWDINWDDFWYDGECEQYVGNGRVKIVTAQFRLVDVTQNTPGLSFRLNEEETGYYVYDYNGTEKDVVITSTYNGLPVIGVSSGAFADSSAQSVYLAEGIKNIEYYAFVGGIVEDVSIPNSIEVVGSNAFPYNMEIEREDGLIYMGNDNNPYLVLIGRRTIYNNITINANTKVIADEVFIGDSHLTSLVIPEGVKRIPEEMLRGSSAIESIIIPASVTSIGVNAFYQCTNLKNIQIKGSLKKIESCAFELCRDLETITFNGNIKEIAEYAFRSCYKLKTVNIDGYVEKIDYDAFKYCEKLEHIDFNEGLKEIEGGAFCGCRCLSSISIPNSIENLDRGAFDECPNDIFYIENNARYLGNSQNQYLVFVGLENSTKTIYIKAQTKLYMGYLEGNYENVYFDGTLNEWLAFASYKALGKYGTRWYFNNCYINNAKLQGEVVIPNTMTEIPYLAFNGQDQITSVVIPNTITKIGERAFNGCSAITSITIPNSVESIEESAFSGCTLLENVVLPQNSNYTVISYSCFSYCSSLESITIPNTVETIMEFAFYACTALEEVTLPNSLNTINDYVFYECSSLESITIPNSVTDLGCWTFADCLSLQNVVLSNQLEIIDYCTFFGCTALTSITIPNSVTEILANAFNRSGLISIVIPSGVTLLEQGVFEDCGSLLGILIPASVETIEQNFVRNANANLKIYYNGTEATWNQIDIQSTGNQRLSDRIIVKTMASLADAISDNNYSFNYNSTNYDFYGQNIKIGSTTFVREGDDYVGYEFVAENNKVKFNNVGTQDLTQIERIRDGISVYMFNGDEYQITFVNGLLAYVSNKVFEIDDVEISNRMIKFDGENCIFSLTADGDDYVVAMTNIGQNYILTPTNNEASLYFMAMDYYNNFTQVNIVHLINPIDSNDYGNEVNYKLDGNKVYLQQTSYASSTSTTRYLSKEGDNYYYYQSYNYQWYKSSITEEQYNQNKSTGISADTRTLLFDGSNYTKNGDVYYYTGEEVYFEMQGERFTFDNIELTIDDDVLTISFTVAGGVITGTYTFSNVNTTNITLPVVA